MRSTDIRAVPSSGSAVIDFDVGHQGVGAVVVHNASYRTLTLTLTNGISRVIAANRSDLVTVGQATFDGHVTLTPGVLVASQTDAGSVWVDVYLPGERIDGTYPAPCANAMTSGNQQPRFVTVAVNASLLSVISVAATGAGATTLTNLSLPASGVCVMRVYGISLSVFSAVSQPYSLGVILQLQPNVGAAILLWRGFVSDTNARDIYPPHPIAQVVTNAGGATSVALQLAQTSLFNPGAAAVTLYVSVYSDMDAKNAIAVPSEGGGFSFSPSTPFPGQSQYIGTVF